MLESSVPLLPSYTTCGEAKSSSPTGRYPMLNFRRNTMRKARSRQERRLRDSDARKVEVVVGRVRIACLGTGFQGWTTV